MEEKEKLLKNELKLLNTTQQDKEDNFMTVRDSFFPNLQSDAFVLGKPDISNILVSEVHQILNYNKKYLENLDYVYFKTLKMENLNELFSLHQEWFPVKYNRDYFVQYLENNTNKVAIGAFLNIKRKGYLVGSILVDLRSEGEMLKILPDILEQENQYYNEINHLKSRSCLSRFCDPYYFAYISTIGVIDELRKHGLGRKLLEKVFEILSLRDKCFGVYLHVITYNKSAIAFYEKLHWYRGKLSKDHYIINEAYFNSFSYYKFFNKFHKLCKVSPDGSSNIFLEVKTTKVNNNEDKIFFKFFRKIKQLFKNITKLF
jgi:ribosomal protein S18 acetylase RimI-like enzyme